MEILLKHIEDNLNKELEVISISNPRRAEEVRRYVVRPVLIREKLLFQLASYTKTQVFHENLPADQLYDRIKEILPAYRQVQLKGSQGGLQALINKKGKASLRQDKKKTDQSAGDDRPLTRIRSLSHNRKKRYILEEGQAVPFLVDLGVMTREGRVVKSRYDKFRQINRFLEFIEDILPHLPGDREVTILDFGCGKSYLTFAVYYYLRELKGYPVRIIGLDLKKDVIRHCSRLASEYGYDHLHFFEGAIEDYEGVDQVDMVITLHACDTATDYALYKAVRWGAGVILSVPCCQHELNGQLTGCRFGPVTNYGILKERFAALATDGVRADLLASLGYDTQVLEFIDMEHTPKNLLIRAVKGKKPSGRKEQEDRDFCRQFGFEPTLMKLLDTERTDGG
ncbi:MAG: SAM-dependent methyltransferase [Eubacterium sp.]|nr:SAM-dependent methyltransferase [Eubacterium sp.]